MNFKVDILIQVNGTAIEALEKIKKRMSLMSTNEATNFVLDDKYGCDSPTLMVRAIKKIYGY